MGYRNKVHNDIDREDGTTESARMTDPRKGKGRKTPKRRDAVRARRDAVDWDNPSYGGLVRGDKVPEVGFGNALTGLKNAILPKK